jgi:hypothetical protein
MASRARPPNGVERPNGQPGRSNSRTLTDQTRITHTVADAGDDVSGDLAEAAEQLAWEAHLAELCPDDCPWCAGGRWAT